MDKTGFTVYGSGPPGQEMPHYVEKNNLYVYAKEYPEIENIKLKHKRAEFLMQKWLEKYGTPPLPITITPNHNLLTFGKNMTKYSKELDLSVAVGSTIKGKIIVTIGHDLHPLANLLPTAYAQIDAFINDQHFSRQIITDYIPGENSNEQQLFDALSKIETSIRRQMSWLANGGEKSFQQKMTEKGFSQIHPT